MSSLSNIDVIILANCTTIKDTFQNRKHIYGNHLNVQGKCFRSRYVNQRLHHQWYFHRDLVVKRNIRD
jgi:hypothetical protein